MRLRYWRALVVGSLISPDGNLHACRHHEVDILITRVPPSEAATKTGSWAAASRGVN